MRCPIDASSAWSRFGGPRIARETFVKPQDDAPERDRDGDEPDVPEVPPTEPEPVPVEEPPDAPERRGPYVVNRYESGRARDASRTA